ncbi:MAG: hypothetical protein AAFQ41_09175 [Cyanobacteria bacterium J06623_7]
MNSKQVFIINDLRLLWKEEVRIFNLDCRKSKAIALCQLRHAIAC